MLGQAALSLQRGTGHREARRAQAGQPQPALHGCRLPGGVGGFAASGQGRVPLGAGFVELALGPPQASEVGAAARGQCAGGRATEQPGAERAFGLRCDACPPGKPALAQGIGKRRELRERGRVELEGEPLLNRPARSAKCARVHLGGKLGRVVGGARARLGAQAALAVGLGVER